MTMCEIVTRIYGISDEMCEIVTRRYGISDEMCEIVTRRYGISDEMCEIVTTEDVGGEVRVSIRCSIIDDYLVNVCK